MIAGVRRWIATPSSPFSLERFWVWDADPGAEEDDVDGCFRGLVTIGTEGCGMDWRVIVTGEQRGMMWNVEAQGAQPCAPARDFLGWYRLWLRWKDAGAEASGRDWWQTVWADARPPS